MSYIRVSLRALLLLTILIVGPVVALGATALALAMSGPFCWLWWRESKAGPGDDYRWIDEQADDPEDAMLKRQIASGLVPIWVIPLSEFSRVGRTLDRIARAEGKAPIGNVPPRERLVGRFVLMYALGFSRKVAGRIGPSERLRGEVDEIMPGFITDFTSIPAPLQSLVGYPTGSYSRAAIVHDWAYAYHHDRSYKGRLDCDRAILKLMREDDTHPARRAAIYLGLRLGGGSAFRRAPTRRDRLEAETKGLRQYLDLAREAMWGSLETMFAPKKP